MQQTNTYGFALRTPLNKFINATGVFAKKISFFMIGLAGFFACSAAYAGTIVDIIGRT